MKKKTIVAIMTALTLTMSLSACGSIPTSGSNSDIARIEELEQENKELKAEIKELKEQLDNVDSANSSQQPTSETDSLLQATIASPETSGVCGADLTWYYQNGVLAITGTGEMTDYSSVKETPWYDLKDKVGWVIIDEGATTVGENAFTDYNELSKIVLPSTLASLGSRAFSGCENLTKITFPVSLTSIGNYALSSCVNVKEITFKGDAPEGIDMVGDFIGEVDIALIENETEEQTNRRWGEAHLLPMTIYYSGSTFDEYINSYPYWSDYGVEWIKQ